MPGARHNGRMPHPALLAVSHGTGSREGQRAVAALADAVTTRLPDVTVRLGHVDVQQPDVAGSLAGLPHQPVVLVPLLLSAGYHVRVDLARATRDREDATIAAAMGPDPRLAAVLVERLTEAGVEEHDAVVLAVAGSSDERANEDCREVARLLAELLGRPVTVGFLAAAEPRLADAVKAANGRVIVGTYLLAPGYFHDLAVRTAGDAIVTRPLLDGDEPPPAIIDLVVDRYRAAAIT